MHVLRLVRFFIFCGRATLFGGERREGARCRFDEDEAETEVSREGEGISKSEVSVSGLEGGESDPGEDVGG